MKQLLLFPDMYDDMINAGINWIAPSKETEDQCIYLHVFYINGDVT